MLAAPQNPSAGCHFRRLMVVCVASCLFLGANPQPMEEYSLKARLLTRLCTFVRWPGEAPESTATQKVLIGILGDYPTTKENPMGAALSALQKQSGGFRFTLVYGVQAAELRNCRVIFLAPACRSRLEDILTVLRGLPVLTVSDSPGFLEKGVQANLAVVNQKVQLEVNEASLKASGLRLDPYLLQLLRPATPKGVNP